MPPVFPSVIDPFPKNRHDYLILIAATDQEKLTTAGSMITIKARRSNWYY